jgi:predicted TIM-barrel fold metal-dependent hydrolase
MKWHISRGLSKKLLFGTDWPIYRFWGNQVGWVNAIKSCQTEGIISQEDMDNIFFRNIKTILPAKVGKQ